jgi:uncharacterized lipoprotein NlpE involved in copper resistance
MVKGALSLALVLAISGCASTSPKQEVAPVNFDYAVGIADANCLAIKNTSLLRGEAVTIVSNDESQTVVSAFVDTLESDDCSGVSDERKTANQEAGYTYYSLVGMPKAFETGVAFTFAFTQDQLSALDLNANGQYEAVSQCVSFSGARLSVTEQADTSVNVWEAEYYLGEGQESTCP